MDEEMVTLEAITENNVEKCGPTGEAFTYVDISSIDREKKVISEPKILAFADAPSRARQVLCSGDVLVSMTRPNLNAVAMVTPEFHGAIGSTGFHVLRSPKALPKFLFYLVQSNSFIDEMCKCVQGALYPAVRPKDISSFEFFLPSSLEEQQNIVAAIDTQLSRLDEAVASLKRIQANLKRYKAAVLKAAVEGKLTEQWRKDHPSVEPADQLLKQILAERRAKWETEELAKMKAKGIKPKDDSWKRKYKEPAGPDTDILPELPVGWVWVNIEQLKIFSLYGPRFSSDDYSDDGYVVLRTSDINDSGKVNTIAAPRLMIDINDFQKYKVQIGDLLITRTGSLGTLALFNDDVEAIPGAYLNESPRRKRTGYLQLIVDSYIAPRGGEFTLNTDSISANRRI